MVKDLNPLTTPNSVLTDVLNGTMITFNGNEFVLQNDMGNGIVERAKLSPGFLPLGVKEYGGIIYVASYNPDTQECEVGSFPSPERDITGTNKIEYQTGLRDAQFITGEYRTATLRVGGIFSEEPVRIQLKKLNQQEVLQLAPGDMYVTTFEVLDPGSAATGQEEILNTTDFYDFFSVNPAIKKVFSVNFYKVDDTNNIKLIKEAQNLIPYTGNVEEDSFTYYTENSKGSIVIGIELNGLVEYNAAVREISKKSDIIKRLRIEAVGLSDSMVQFEGVRVDANALSEDNTTKNISFHINKDSTVSNKVSMDVTDLKELDIVSLDVTPYTQYGYIPELMKSFRLQMGVAFGGQNVNDVFRWRTNSSSIELDFDFKFQTDHNLSLYLEFYDVWSNYSVITTYTDPSIYGPMRINIPLINEPRTEVFNNEQSGGTNFTNLVDNLDTIHLPVMVNLAQNNGKNLVRRTFELRKDHFYIVRICGIERVIENDTLVDIIYNDVYKLLYTNTAYNSIYDSQNNIAFDDPGYIGDFNQIPYPLEKISYSATLQSGNLSIARILGQLPPEGTGAGQLPTETVNNIRQIFAVNEQPLANDLTVEDTYTANQQHLMNVVVSNKNLIYGRIKPNLFILETLSNSQNIDNSKIIEDTIISEIPTDSQGTITIPNITGEGNYTITVNVSTKRKIKGSFTKETINVNRVVQNGTLEDLLFKHNVSGKACQCNDEGNPSCQDGTQFTLYRTTYNGGNSRGGCTWGKSEWSIRFRIKNHTNNTEYNVYQGKNLDNPVNNDGAAFNSVTLNSKQFFLASTGSYMRGMQGSSQLVFRARAASNPSDARIVVFASKSNPNGISNPNLVAGVLRQLIKYEVQNGSNNNYYVNPNTLLYHENATTLFKEISLELTSKYNATIKTYVFDTLFKGNNNLSWTSLTTDLINNYISSLNTGNNNLQSTINDNGFIPFVNANNQYQKNINFILPDINITKGIDINMLTLFVDSNNNYLQYLGTLENQADNFDPTRPVVSANLNNQSLVDFAKIFRWVNNELNIDPTVGIETTQAITRYEGESFLRTYDKVIDPLFPL